MADLHVQREGVEHHGADEGDARRHGVHDLEFAAGELIGRSVIFWPILLILPIQQKKVIANQSI